MSMEADLARYLKDDADLGALVGERIYPLNRLQGQPSPAVTLTRISGGPEYADDGNVGISNVRMQIDCWGATYAQAKSTAEAVFTRLDGLRDVTQGDTFFIYVWLDNEQERSEGGSNTSEYLLSVSQDWMVWFRSA